MNVYDAIHTRRSVRAYADKPIPREVLQRLMEALRLAPSAANAQPWRCIFVTDRVMKEAVARSCKERMWIAGAAAVVVGCGFPEQAYALMGGSGNSVDIDLAIALDHLSLAARNEGLGTCWIGAFAEREIKALLTIPGRAKIVSLMTVGYPADPGVFAPAGKKRKKNGDIISFEKY